ncbi:unnamed protein product [Brachionus calyciflorus]|uniref:Uncharacterized protein n=1 Tax=Brachionus calyciflorus TaxID=104777 RepID=A0A814K5V7_9BILA|nr:unnamed protein product [Brachionus calyciflorus]
MNLFKKKFKESLTTVYELIKKKEEIVEEDENNRDSKRIKIRGSKYEKIETASLGCFKEAKPILMERANKFMEDFQMTDFIANTAARKNESQMEMNFINYANINDDLITATNLTDYLIVENIEAKSQVDSNNTKYTESEYESDLTEDILTRKDNQLEFLKCVYMLIKR